MATKKPPPKPKKFPLLTWTVNIDGVASQIEAHDCEITAAGLVFWTDGVAVRAVAAGHWQTVELTRPEAAEPPPEPA